MRITERTRFGFGLLLILAALLVVRPFAGSAQQAAPESTRSIRGVTVHYQYDANRFFPALWLAPPTECEGTQIAPEDLSRATPVVKQFTAVYGQDLLDANLRDIFLLGDLHCYGQGFGGTNSRDGLYIKVGPLWEGYTEDFLFSIMHAEFSSILMRNYDFPTREWAAINDKAFVYSENAVEVVEQTDQYDQNEALFQGGFLRRYATTSLENDFNEFASWLFNQQDSLCYYRLQYQRIEQKASLAIRFFQSVDPTLTFEACT